MSLKIMVLTLAVLIVGGLGLFATAGRVRAEGACPMISKVQLLADIEEMVKKGIIKADAPRWVFDKDQLDKFREYALEVTNGQAQVAEGDELMAARPYDDVTNLYLETVNFVVIRDGCVVQVVRGVPLRTWEKFIELIRGHAI